MHPIYALADYNEQINDWLEVISWTPQYLHGFKYDMAIQTMHYLIEKQNFSKYGAAGIVGNIYCECRFDPEASNGYHIGIMQWDWKARWPKITSWLQEQNLSTYDFCGQVKAIFLSDDANDYQEVFARMRTMTDAVRAADYWQILYEGAEGQGTGQRELGARLSLALYELDTHGFYYDETTNTMQRSV